MHKTTNFYNSGSLKNFRVSIQKYNLFELIFCVRSSNFSIQVYLRILKNKLDIKKPKKQVTLAHAWIKWAFFSDDLHILESIVNAFQLSKGKIVFFLNTWKCGVHVENKKGEEVVDTTHSLVARPVSVLFLYDVHSGKLGTLFVRCLQVRYIHPSLLSLFPKVARVRHLCWSRSKYF